MLWGKSPDRCGSDTTAILLRSLRYKIEILTAALNGLEKCFKDTENFVCKCRSEINDENTPPDLKEDRKVAIAVLEKDNLPDLMARKRAEVQERLAILKMRAALLQSGLGGRPASCPPEALQQQAMGDFVEPRHDDDSDDPSAPPTPST